MILKRFSPMVRPGLLVLTLFLYTYAYYGSHQINGTVTDDITVVQKSYPPSAQDAPAIYEEFFIQRKKKNAMVHVSSIAGIDDHTVGSVWYGGSREGARDVSIYFAVFDEKTGAWTDPEVLVDRVSASRELKRYIKKVGNPLLFSDDGNRLWLFYSTVTVGGWSGTSLNYKISVDNGKTWSESRKLILSPFFNLTQNVKNNGLLLDDGSILIPVYHEFIRKYSQLLRLFPTEKAVWYSIAKITTGGAAIQPVLLHRGCRDLTAFFRNMSKKKERHILQAHSGNLGDSWSRLSETTLPNPNAGFDMLSLKNGAILGVINPSFRDRHVLALVISEDNGMSWKTIKVLEDNEGKEYSYPSIIRSASGLYHITYTFERRAIKHVLFNDPWLTQHREARD